MFENPYNHPHGTICVVREVYGKPIALRVLPQEYGTNWPGCFTLLY